MEDNADTTEEIFLVHAAYKCGSLIGFLAKNVLDAHTQASKIASDVCPICKLREAVALNAEELSALWEEFLREENAKASLN